MAELITYYAARRLLDDAIEKMRVRLDAAFVTSVARLEVDLAIGELNGLENWEMIVALRYQAARHVLKGWLVARAALVGLILPQSNPATSKPRSTRNRRKPSGAAKVFPSDSPNVTHQGHHYRARVLPEKMRKLPKLALISEHKKGRPEVPPEWRRYRVCRARARQLKAARAATAERRKKKGWKKYPERKDYVTRRELLDVAGYRDPASSARTQQGPLVMRAQRQISRGLNKVELAKLAKEKLQKWRDAH